MLSVRCWPVSSSRPASLSRLTEEFRAPIVAEIARRGALIRRANIKLD